MIQAVNFTIGNTGSHHDHEDSSGNVVEITNVSATVVASYRSDAFGRTLDNLTPTPTPTTTASTIPLMAAGRQLLLKLLQQLRCNHMQSSSDGLIQEHHSTINPHL